MHKHHDLPTAFAELGISTPLLIGLNEMGFVEPSDIQRQLIPLALEGKDILGQAQTGTGKTAAFGLPMLQRLKPKEGLQGIVLVPTRELAVQVAAELRRLGSHSSMRGVPVYGGQRIKHQLHLLGHKPQFVVGTPGRVIDLLNRKALKFDNISFTVLDEVDRMLDIGFRDDIRNILSRIKAEHQTVFVSATMNNEIMRLAKGHMRNPVELNVSRDKITVEDVEQAYVTVDPWDKFSMLKHLLAQEKPRLAIIFCNTRRATAKLAKRLHGAGVNAREIHGDLVQQKRERVMERFRKHKLRVLVATDLAARGIDVTGISHIINYDIPDDSEVYVHRIGRTARMGNFGKAISLVTREQGKQLTEIEMLINKEVPQIKVEGFQPSPEPADRRDHSAARPASARSAPTAPVTPPATPAKKKTLGARLRTPRRRRL